MERILIGPDNFISGFFLIEFLLTLFEIIQISPVAHGSDALDVAEVDVIPANLERVLPVLEVVLLEALLPRESDDIQEGNIKSSAHEGEVH